MDGQPVPVLREESHRGCYLPVLVTNRSGLERARELEYLPAQIVKLGHGVAFGFDVRLTIGGVHDAHPLDQAGLISALAARATRAIHSHARRFQPDAPFVSWHRAQVRAGALVPFLSIVRHVAPSDLVTAV